MYPTDSWKRPVRTAYFSITALLCTFNRRSNDKHKPSRKLVTFRFLRKSHSQRDALVTKTSLGASVAVRSAG